MESKFRIETVNTEEQYEGLRTLWCEVFGDEASFVDAMYANFGAKTNAGIYTSSDIIGYVIKAETEGAEGCSFKDAGKGSCEAPYKVVSALTCFRCGDFEGTPVYTSYAICTDPKYRGLGLAGALVERARDDVLERGGISLISPAEPSLEKFYGAHGYTPFFFTDERTSGSNSVEDDEDEDFIFDEEDATYEKADPKTELKPLNYAEYDRYREEFLREIPHVKLNEHMLRLVQAESTLPNGESGLMLINGGDAICALNYVEEDNDLTDDMKVSSATDKDYFADDAKYSFNVDNADYGNSATDSTVQNVIIHVGKSNNGGKNAGSLEIEELLINPLLSSISSEIADEMVCRLAAHFELASIHYKTPGFAHCQSMAAGITESDIKENEAGGIPAYYGFPVQ